jgi:colicin import membrane protein
MKRSLLLSVVLIAFLFCGLNSTFAQDQTIKDKKVQVVKKVEIKKDANGRKEVITTKREGGKKIVTTKKDGVKKDVITKRNGEKKVVITKRDGEKKVITTKKEDMHKEMMRDKEVGRTHEGKQIFEGPHGGRYTLSPSGKKIYIKK